MRRVLLTCLMTIITIAAQAQFKGSVDISPVQNAKPREISFNFAAVCRQLEVDRLEFATILQRGWYRQDSQFKLYLLTDEESGHNDVSNMLTANGKRADWENRVWQCEVFADNTSLNRLYFNVSLCLSERGDMPLAKVGDVCHAIYALEYQGRVATFDITVNVAEQDGPLIPLSSLQKVGEQVISGTCDYQNGLHQEIDIDQVAALFGGDVEGANLQLYVLEDAEKGYIVHYSISNSAALTIDGTLNEEENLGKWLNLEYNFGDGSMVMSVNKFEVFPIGLHATGSMYLVADGKYYELILDIQLGRKEDDDTTLMGYRPFLEEGKIWMLGYYGSEEELTAGSAARIEYLYLEGDTLVGGITCKKWMQTVEKGDAGQSTYIGAAYERGGKVYAAWPGTIDFCLLYDFTSPMGYQGQVFDYSGQQITPYTMGSIVYISDECYKGFAREVSLGNGYAFTKWKYGVGYCGLYNTIRPDEGSGQWRLMACAVGDEVLYYDASLIDWDNSAEAKKKKLDFTHVIKAQPRAPRHRIQQQDGDMQRDGETLQGEYSATEMFVRLNPLAGYYTATLTDASGRAVFQKNVMTDYVLALSTELTGYTPGNYVLTLENHEEVYSATLSIEPDGIGKVQEVQGSEGSSTSEAAKPSTKGSKVQGLFDLQGRRLMKAPEKGLYIRDGQIKMIK